MDNKASHKLMQILKIFPRLSKAQQILKTLVLCQALLMLLWVKHSLRLHLKQTYKYYLNRLANLKIRKLILFQFHLKVRFKVHLLWWAMLALDRKLLVAMFQELWVNKMMVKPYQQTKRLSLKNMKTYFKKQTH